MRTIIMSVIVAGTLMFFAKPGRCAGAEIAVVNMSKVIRALPETKTAESALEEQIKQFELEHKEMLAKLEKLNQDFKDVRKDAQNAALSEEERAKRTELAEKKLNEIKEAEYKIQESAVLKQKQVVDQKDRVREQIMTRIREIITGYAVKKGYNLVLDSSAVAINGAQTIVYNRDVPDITEEVLKLIAGQKSE